MNSKTITARENGPYRVPGPLTVVDGAGAEQRFDQEAVSFCRCGHSGNKPMCDGSHRKAEFKAAAFEIRLD